jgi:hypothetical protein
LLRLPSTSASDYWHKLRSILQVAGYGLVTLARGPVIENGLCPVDQIPSQSHLHNARLTDDDHSDSLLNDARLLFLMPAALIAKHSNRLSSVASRIAAFSNAATALSIPSLLHVSLSVYCRHLAGSQPKSGLPTPPASPAANEAAVARQEDRRPTPAFLLEPSYRRCQPVQFSSEWPPSSHDVLDRHRFLHVAYTAVAKDTIAILMVDDCCEGWELAIERVAVFDPVEVAKRVWACAEKQAARASVEWRIVLQTLHVMGVAELDGELSPAVETAAQRFAAWSKHLAGVLKTSSKALHVSICAVTQPSWGCLHVHNEATAAMAMEVDVEDGEEQDVQATFFDRQRSTLAHAVYHQSAVAFSSLYTISSSSVYINTFDQLHTPHPTTQAPAFHVHILHMAHTPASLLSISLNRHMQDLTSNLVDLWHFGSIRYPQLASFKLPWHLAFIQSLKTGAAVPTDIAAIAPAASST